jgi:hypothetical protein
VHSLTPFLPMSPLQACEYPSRVSCISLPHLETSTDSICSYTTQSKIGMSRLYQQALMTWDKKDLNKQYSSYFARILQNAGVPASHAPEGFEEDLISPILRTHLLLAILFVHEFSHAFCKAYFERPDLSRPREPFVGDLRACEFGIAVERHMLSGVAYASCVEPPTVMSKWNWISKTSAFAPFGIYFSEKFGQWSNPGPSWTGIQHLSEGKHADFTSPVRSFPVPQRQVFDYFTKKMWETHVPRYGLDALMFAKIPAWASAKTPGPNPLLPWSQYTLR